MSLYVVRVPDIGEGVAEVELVAWHVKPGDRIVEDQVLADVMTDKATVEVPAPVHGVVVALGGEPGQVLAVGADLIRIETEGAQRAGASMPAGPAPWPQAAPQRSQGAPTPRPPPAQAAPAPQPGLPLPPAPPQLLPVAATTTDAASQRVLASPSVRARAWELGIDITQVRASHPTGRVMHRDLEAHVAGGGGAHRAAPPAAAPRIAAVRPTDEDHVEAVKIIGLRRKIAQKMQDAKRRIPHFSYHEEVDVTELEALREHLNRRAQARAAPAATTTTPPSPRLSPLAFVIRALARAAPEFPQVNATLDDEAGVLYRHTAVHVGVATQTDAGLLVPVLRNAQALDLVGIAAETARIAALARSGKATRGELTGSTLTVTSLGKLSGIATTPVINAPEVTIVGVNKIVERPMMRAGAVVGRSMMTLSGSFDHRVVDGAVAAEFVQRLRELLEHPAALFVDAG